jgi:hypothetical protein
MVAAFGVTARDRTGSLSCVTCATLEAFRPEALESRVTLELETDVLEPAVPGSGDSEILNPAPAAPPVASERRRLGPPVASERGRLGPPVASERYTSKGPSVASERGRLGPPVASERYAYDLITGFRGVCRLGDEDVADEILGDS